MRVGLGLPITVSPGAPVWWRGGAKDAQHFARFDGLYGAGGFYYADNAAKSFVDVIATPPAGEPTSAGMLVGGVDAPTLVQGHGPELVANGEFEANTLGWTDQDSTLAAVGGEMVITKNAGGNYGYANADIPVAIGKTYRIQATIRCGSADQIRLAMSEAISRNSGADNTPSTSPVEIEYEGEATTTNLKLQFVVYTIGTEEATAIVDKVSVQEVLPYPGYATEDRLGDEFVLNYDFATPTDWTLGDGFEIVNGQLVAIGVASFVATTQLRPIEIGARYKVVLDIAEITSGTLRAGFSGGAAVFGANFSTAGIKEFELTAGSGNDRIFMNTVNASVSCKINSVSIRRIYRDHTVKVEWNANSATGDRVVWECRKDANNRLALRFVTGVLRFEGFVGGVSQGAATVAGKDDGGSHSAVLCWDEVTDTLSVRVDGAAAVTATATDTPTNLNQIALGHSGGASQLNGYVLEHAAANGLLS